MPQKCCSDKELEKSSQLFVDLLRKDFVPAWPSDPDMGIVYRCLSLPSDGQFSAASTRPVLLLHEYDHLSIFCLEFADRLSRAGFTVYLPLLFGKSDGKSGLGTTICNTLEIGFSGKWHALFGEHEHQPVTDWLGKVCRRISADHGYRGIGVIGMCLTGALPIALLNEPCVVAPVVAQPAIPLFPLTSEAKRATGISPAELENAVKRTKSQHLKLFGTRYQEDSIGRIERFEAIKTAFGPACFEDHTIAARDYLSPSKNWGLTDKAHATLTLCYRDSPNDYPPRKLFLDLVDFLKMQLAIHGAPTR
jgi:dienelactone hydrolase